MKDLKQPITAAPWDRRATETRRQYEVFKAYREAGPLRRSLAKVAQQLGYSSTYVERLSALNGWSERVEAFDLEQDRRFEQLRWRHIQDMRTRQSDIAVLALEKTREGLQNLDPSSMRAGDLARLLDVAGRLERVARGVSDDSSDGERRFVINADEVRRALREEGLLGDTK